MPNMDDRSAPCPELCDQLGRVASGSLGPNQGELATREIVVLQVNDHQSLLAHRAAFLSICSRAPSTVQWPSRITSARSGFRRDWRPWSAFIGGKIVRYVPLADPLSWATIP